MRNDPHDLRRRDDDRPAGKGGKLSAVQLASCYIASLLICVLCVLEAVKPETSTRGAVLYGILAVIGVLSSVFITARDRRGAGGGRTKDGGGKKR